MKNLIALTAVGEDRPGIVAAVTRILYENGCNIEDSSMTILRGEFAMILIISVRRGAGVRLLEGRFSKLAHRMKLFIALRRITPARARSLKRAAPSHIISLLGGDRPGIVYGVSKLLASRGVNITDLNTRLVGSRARPVYAMVIEAQVPPRVSVPRLKSDLNRLGERMHVSVTIRPLDIAEL